jgi:hypothetical protein
MAVFAELADGRRLEFPDGTDPSVVQATVKKVIGNTQPPTPPTVTGANDNYMPNEIRDYNEFNQQWSQDMQNAPKGSEIARVDARIENTPKIDSVNFNPPNTQALPTQNKQAVAPQKPVQFTPEMTELSFAEKLAQKILPKDGFSNETVDMANNIAAGATSMNRGIGNLVAGENTFKPKPSPTGAEVDKGSMSYLGGQIIDPTSWALLSGMGKLPVVGKALQFQPVTGTGKLATIGKNVVAGAGTGSVLGGLSEDGTFGEGALYGGIGGAVIPSAISGINYGIKKGGHLFQNADLSSGRYANEVANASGKRDQIVAALQEQNLPFSGSANAGQATAKVGSPEFAALQEFANIQKPTPAANLASFQEAQRASTLNSIGRGDTNELAMAVTNRATKANPLYSAADKSMANVDKTDVLNKIRDVYSKNKNEAIAEPMKELFGKISKSNSPRELISASRRIKELMGQSNDGKLAYDTKVLTTLKESLDDAIGKTVPEYTAARETFKTLSKPVNRMQVGQELQNTLKSPLDVGERGAVFAKAVDNAPKTMKAATGFPRFNKLGDVLEPVEVSAVDRVTKELMTNAAQKELAQKGMQATGKILGAQVKPPQIPNPLNSTITYTNSFLRALTGKVSDKTLNALATNMNNPAKLAQLMQQASAAERDLISKTMMQIGTQGINNATVGQ